MTPKKSEKGSDNQQKKKYIPPKEINPEHKEIMTTIADNLERLRKEKSVSIVQLTKDVQMARNVYYQLINASVYCNIRVLLKLAAYYNVNIDEFFNS